MQQERCARRDAWEMAKHVHKLEEKDYSPSEVWSLPAPSSTRTRGKRICGGFWSISMHVPSRKDLNFDELENVRVSRKTYDARDVQWRTRRETRNQQCTCNTENCVPIVVAGLSTGSSCSTASTSPTSLPQDTSVDSSSSPAKTRRRSTSLPVLGNQLRDPTEIQDTKIRTPYRYRETCCEICQSGQSSQKI